jgi:hypothetical protein
MGKINNGFLKFEATRQLHAHQTSHAALECFKQTFRNDVAYVVCRLFVACRSRVSFASCCYVVML